MNDPRPVAASKHFASLTALLLAIFVVSASGMLFRLDFNAYRAEVQALSTLSDFSRLDWSPQAPATGRSIYGALRAWIGSNQPALIPKLRGHLETAPGVDGQGQNVVPSSCQSQLGGPHVDPDHPAPA